MKYKVSFLAETESNTSYFDSKFFTDLETAKKEFKKAVKNQGRYRQSDEDDFKEYLTESIVLESCDAQGYGWDVLMRQIIYSEGVIDRMNWRGSNAINYYSRATFNGRELMHTMFFQGEKEMWGKKHKVPQSKIKDWYFRS